MAAVAEKARYHLEQAVPQLRDFEEKKIFSKDEIRTLVSKRSEFEHRVLAPRSNPEDFLAYAAWEQSLETLRAKRCRRLRLLPGHQSDKKQQQRHRHAPSPATTPYAGRARAANIFERGVSRHPGSAALWRAYLDFFSSSSSSSTSTATGFGPGSAKRWRRTAARALRLHPADAGLWALAGRRAARAGDMAAARGYFMRGCRFCVGDAALWVEYARCEMEWLRKVEGKRRKTTTTLTTTTAITTEQHSGGGGGVAATNDSGLAAIHASEAAEQDGDIIEFDDEGDDSDDADGDVILPDVDGHGGDVSAAARKVFTEEAVKKLETSPALEGAIPATIFEIAKKQPFFRASAAADFFDVFAAFPDVSAQGRIVQKVLDTMAELYPDDPATYSCLVKRPVVGVDVHSPAFPRALRESLAQLKEGLERVKDKKALATRTVTWIESILVVDDVDAGIRTVLEHTKLKLESL